ncbi:type II toxin-antitoxin system RelE/ParE family toxin [Candidatus Nomurabacteria bacterium]|nr:type II toxin-antitoxin system RelE/ParE family toxin [Candidatus Nomurabacteria bacterium]
MEIKNFSTDIDKFILNLDFTVSSRINKTLALLKELGNQVEMPYSKSLGNGLFELRISGKIPIRIIYCFHENCAILLNAFVKKQDKLPKKELDLAKKRQKMLA